jgi:hypothetical protein
MARHRSRHEPAADASGNPAPDSGGGIDALRRELAEKLEAFVRQNAWPRCTRPACKRARACRAHGAECAGLPNEPEPSPEQWEQILFNLKCALARRSAAFGAEERGGGAYLSAPPGTASPDRPSRRRGAPT